MPIRDRAYKLQVEVPVQWHRWCIKVVFDVLHRSPPFCARADLTYLVCGVLMIRFKPAFVAVGFAFVPRDVAILKGCPSLAFYAFFVAELHHCRLCST